MSGEWGRTHPQRKPYNQNVKIGKGNPPFEQFFFELNFDLPNHYSNNIVITDSDSILTERKCAVAISGVVSFKTALAVNFKREYKKIEFLWKQRPGVGGMIALTPVASQIPGKY